MKSNKWIDALFIVTIITVVALAINAIMTRSKPVACGIKPTKQQRDNDRIKQRGESKCR